MPRSRQMSRLLLPVLFSLLAIFPLGAREARSQGASAWKIATQHDALADRDSRIAVTVPKSDPTQDGKPVTTALIISCGSTNPNGPTHPQLTILFTPLTHMFHVDAVTARYRFDEGPVRQYKLGIHGRNSAYTIELPKLTDQDPITDLLAAKRLRAEVYLPRTTNTLLDFNLSGAAEAVRAIACR